MGVSLVHSSCLLAAGCDTNCYVVCDSYIGGPAGFPHQRWTHQWLCS